MNAELFVSTLSHPDDVGQAEYRALYDLLESAAENCNGDMTPKDELEHLDCILEQVIEQAQSLRESLRNRIAQAK